MSAPFAALETPCLLLDRERLLRNVAAMEQRCRALGVAHRPHLKTAKSLDVARQIRSAFAHGATASTVAEVEYYAAGGIRDLLYAVCIEPRKLPRLARVAERGATVRVAVDDPRALALLIDAWPSLTRAPLAVLVEIDSGEHRSGLAPDADSVVELARRIDAAPGLAFGGVFTHAGHSYGARGAGALRAIAEQERAAVVHAAERLRTAGLHCEVVSVGSTPTAVHVERLDGVTELRAGVYVFGDAFQAALGACSFDDIALTVLSTVIGVRSRERRLVIDAGGLALSKDRSTAALGGAADVGYGLVATAEGELVPGARVVDAYQEHGIVALPEPVDPARFPIGATLRIVPNHACITAAAHARYHVVDGADVVADWPRIGGWE
ncbi:MAG: alanine racemase [Planctomycetes bacterium]|nr:alanine racemase [Planctomycetota bacterium]